VLLRFDNIVILSTVRTPIGKFGKSLKEIRAPELGSIAIREAIERSGVEVDDIGLVVMGNVSKSRGGC
jgi:Acetyl-CoA acetyltransferase